MANPWLAHLGKFYKANKAKMSYTQAMKAARASYKPMATGAPATKKRRSSKKKGKKGRKTRGKK